MQSQIIYAASRSLDAHRSAVLYCTIAPPLNGRPSISAHSDEGDMMSEEPQEQAPVRTLEPPVNENIPEMRAGDTVNVHLLVREGDRERVQEFRGTVIRMRNGGPNATFTVRRTASHGVGVERTFLIRSPLLQKVEIIRRAKVRQAQLYYLRERAGKKARLRERREA